MQTDAMCSKNLWYHGVMSVMMVMALLLPSMRLYAQPDTTKHIVSSLPIQEMHAYPQNILYQDQEQPIAGRASTSAKDTTLSNQEKSLIEYLRTRPLSWFAGIAVSNSVPYGEFKQVMDSIGKSTFWGFQLHGGYAFDPVPIAVGMSVDILFAGSTTRTYTRGTFPFRSFDTLRVSNTIIPLNIFGRIQPIITPFPGWSIRPFFEGFVGLTVLSSSITFQSNGVSQSDDTDASAPLHYGIGSGVQIQLMESLSLPAHRTTIALDVRGRYVAGAQAEYRMVQWDDRINAPQSTFLRSTTGMMLWSLGITVQF
jgi:hypothetical protein